MHELRWSQTQKWVWHLIHGFAYTLLMFDKKWCKRKIKVLITTLKPLATQKVFQVSD